MMEEVDIDSICGIYGFSSEDWGNVADKIRWRGDQETRRRSKTIGIRWSKYMDIEIAHN